MSSLSSQLATHPPGTIVSKTRSGLSLYYWCILLQKKGQNDLPSTTVETIIHLLEVSKIKLGAIFLPSNFIQLTIKYHHIPSWSILNHYEPLYTIIKHHLLFMKNIFNHRPSWTIMDHQRPSVTIRDHQWPSVTIRDHQRSSETIIVNQRPSQTNIASLTITDSTTYFIQSNLYWSFQYHLNCLPKHSLQNHLHTILIVELHLLRSHAFFGTKLHSSWGMRVGNSLLVTLHIVSGLISQTFSGLSRTTVQWYSLLLIWKRCHTSNAVPRLSAHSWDAKIITPACMPRLFLCLCLTGQPHPATS